MGARMVRRGAGATDMSGQWIRVGTVALALAAYGTLASVAVAADHDVEIAGLAFGPATITVAAGDTVTWTNEDASRHTATGDGFDTGALVHGASGSITFTTAGRFDYVCSLFAGMKGTIVVMPSAAAAGGTAAGGTRVAGTQADGTRSVGARAGRTAPPTDTGPGYTGDPGPAGSSVPGVPFILALAGLAGIAIVTRRPTARAAARRAALEALRAAVRSGGQANR
jgi:plastocyanin